MRQAGGLQEGRVALSLSPLWEIRLSRGGRAGSRPLSAHSWSWRGPLRVFQPGNGLYPATWSIKAMQGTQVPSLVREGPTGCGTTNPRLHNCRKPCAARKTQLWENRVRIPKIRSSSMHHPLTEPQGSTIAHTSVASTPVSGASRHFRHSRQCFQDISVLPPTPSGAAHSAATEGKLPLPCPREDKVSCLPLWSVSLLVDQLHLSHLLVIARVQGVSSVFFPSGLFSSVCEFPFYLRWVHLLSLAQHMIPSTWLDDVYPFSFYPFYSYITLLK